MLYLGIIRRIQNWNFFTNFSISNISILCGTKNLNHNTQEELVARILATIWNCRQKAQYHRHTYSITPSW